MMSSMRREAASFGDPNSPDAGTEGVPQSEVEQQAGNAVERKPAA